MVNENEYINCYNRYLQEINVFSSTSVTYLDVTYTT
jgi:hypothetical protein